MAERQGPDVVDAPAIGDTEVLVRGNRNSVTGEGALADCQGPGVPDAAARGVCGAASHVAGEGAVADRHGPPVNDATAAAIEGAVIREGGLADGRGSRAVDGAAGRARVAGEGALA